MDDVLIAAAARAGRRYDSFAAVQQFHFERDMSALGVRPPAYEPRAHAHVVQVIQLAAALLQTGDAYLRDGSVYFRGAPMTMISEPRRSASRTIFSASCSAPSTFASYSLSSGVT